MIINLQNCIKDNKGYNIIYIFIKKIHKKIQGYTNKITKQI